MTILKLSKLTTSESKEYRVSEGILYINNDPLEIDGLDDLTIDSWESPSEDDIASIERDEEDNVVISLNVYTDAKTRDAFFSIVRKSEILEDATFPYQIIDGEVVWYNNIEAFEGMEW